MRREVWNARERRRERVWLQHAVWYCLPWYTKAWRTITLRRPEPYTLELG